ncbi:WXG100 family type VII secretion target [Actinoallomurus rhizosphaericola]|uniref:WXG100 family type VII secretion target n=1 Tax=Actinoallomurus rhizosphaericola TaxID=2952536 RepID=UPI0020907B33|nr:WXG100 family type VII secretion target [Actinoallomurus rhizosphaericola]MCO5994326.1 WXG100 family type VII secretion target [Actinoallomurus rhizosphaericola]
MSEDFTDGYIYVDYNHMNNAADDLVSQTQAIAKTISSMEQELTELKKQWIGEDAQVYTQKQQAWDNAIKTMEQILTSHSQLLDEISGSYKYNENSLSQMWSEVRIGG